MNRVTARLLPLIAALAAFMPALLQAQGAPLVVYDAWMRKVPGADTASVYLVLRNTSVQPVIVIGVRSPVASHVMIHETSTVGAQSRMRPHEKLVIAPGKSMALEPGGVHLMLTGFKTSPLIGQTVPLVLLLSNGETVAVAAVVKPLDGK